jgi:flagellar FliJ protein
MPSQLPIGTLSQLARTRTDEAARTLAALRDANLSAARKLEVLLQYRQEYTRQLQSLLAQGATTAQWRNYQEFLQALDAGIEHQRGVAVQAEARLDRGRVDWQHQRRRLNAYETLADRIQRQEAVVQGRREQRASDEQAARMAQAGAAHAGEVR